MKMDKVHTHSVVKWSVFHLTVSVAHFLKGHLKHTHTHKDTQINIRNEMKWKAFKWIYDQWNLSTFITNEKHTEPHIHT